MKGIFKYLTFRRLIRIFWMWHANTLPMQGHHRYRFVKHGGVNIKGPCYIYKNVYFDSVAPHLITIGEVHI